jgi:S-DNA-T family DNA segregation ATPase FtsK/SpoIIIE
MTRSIPADFDGRSLRFTVLHFLWRQAKAIVGLGLVGLIGLSVAALATWNVLDPSFSNATARVPSNLLGQPGAYFADATMQFFGLGSVLALLPIFAWALMMVLNIPVYRVPKRAAAWIGGSILASAMLSCMPAPETWPIPNGLGGVFGDMVLKFPALFLGHYPEGISAFVIAVLCGVPALGLLAFSANLIVTDRPVNEKLPVKPPTMPVRLARPAPVVEDEEREPPFAYIVGYAAHAWYSTQARLRRLVGRPARRQPKMIEEPYDLNEEEFGLMHEDAAVSARSEPAMEAREPSIVSSPRRIIAAPPVAPDDGDYDDDEFDLPRPAGVLADDEDDEDDDWQVRPEVRGPQKTAPVMPSVMGASEGARRVAPAAPAPRAAPRPTATAAPRRDGFDLPPVDLLAEPKNVAKDATLSSDALEQNARILEGVLDDFGVKGSIIHVRPGPVVTLYELEPAPGIKSSRVIGLADDIASSMSAIAARVAVVPGRNAIGIELPNKSREMVFLRELIAARDFEGSKAKLALTLGKTIGGEPVIADLAKMPHLLVAGTTGSGKSVAINTMILSLVYRMTPEQCRLIMIDPKMLELSVYDGIPHLLSPVVTDPKKAVVALKWTVREMEERYKKMSKIGVRNIDGFNARVAQALEKGEAITRTVQTGFDRQTGEALYETEEFDLQPIPYIVVIIDEMADLMMVAGKEDRKSTRLNSSHNSESRMPSSA